MRFWILPLCLLIGACQGNQSVAGYSSRSGQAEWGELPTHLKVTQIKFLKDRVPAEVQATVENAKEKTETLEYRFHWYDGAGREIESPALRWNIVRVKGLDRINISSVAPGPSAQDYDLKLKVR